MMALSDSANMPAGSGSCKQCTTAYICCWPGCTLHASHQSALNGTAWDLLGIHAANSHQHSILFFVVIQPLQSTYTKDSTKEHFY
jgi:hypothetical protein